VRIVLVHNAYQHPGGEDIVFEQEQRLLERAGNEVIVYRRSNQEIQTLALLERFALLKRSIWSDITERDFTQLLARVNPDLVHVHNTFPMISPSIYGVCDARGIPVVQTLHNFRLMCPSGAFSRDGKVCEECVDRGLWRGVYHGCYRDSRPVSASVALMLSLHRWWGTWTKLITCYIALTEFNRGKFITAGLPADKIVVKPNFVDPDPGPRQTTGRHAIYIGRLAPEKDVSTLLRAWARVPNPPSLHIVGDGPERKHLERLTDQFGLSSVTFRGHLSRETTIAALKEACFVVVPSGSYESFPMCIAEAFACGIPVLCSRLGAMQELVSDGVTGLHFAAGDPVDLARKIEWAFEHDQALARMGLAARLEYETRYTAQRNYDHLMNIYEQTLMAHHQASCLL
jgi:glycosyltransferase involved in cell wall biosynthesis